MQQPVAASASATAGSFASVLAAFSAPAPALEIDWSEDGLGDDIATLSYEQALRNHARNRSFTRSDWPAKLQNDAGHDEVNQSASGPLTAMAGKSPLAQRSSSAVPLTHHRTASVEESRKAASITIRLSRAESARLHERAAEAGLTVSAYLRSCTFEVEALRAQVKEALTQLRPPAAVDPQETIKLSPPPTRNWNSRLLSLLPRWVRPRQTARA